MDNTQLRALGAAVRRARGMIDQTEAARLSGLSRTWWMDLEKGVRPPRPNKLAHALIAIGADIRPVFELAGYDPAPYLGQQERWLNVRALGAEIAVAPSARDDREADLIDTVHEQLVGLRRDVQRMGDVLEQLVEQASTPSGPAATGPRSSPQGSRRAAAPNP